MCTCMCVNLYESMHVCNICLYILYVCKYLCMHAHELHVHTFVFILCKYVYMYGCTDVFMYVCTYACVLVCMFVLNFMYVCRYASYMYHALGRVCLLFLERLVPLSILDMTSFHFGL